MANSCETTTHIQEGINTITINQINEVEVIDTIDETTEEIIEDTPKYNLTIHTIND